MSVKYESMNDTQTRRDDAEPADVVDLSRKVERGDRDPSAGRPREIGGRKGPDPVRYGDWEKNGRCIDF